MAGKRLAVMAFVLLLLLSAVDVGRSLFGDGRSDAPEGSLGFVSEWREESSMCHNNCNGHGRCISLGSGPTCECAIGWGNTDDITEYRSPGCDKRVCPAGEAWASSAIQRRGGVTSAHLLRECSNVGICNRDSGECACPYGYFGEACEKKGCPNDCSGHGRCLSMQQLSQKADALPLSAFVQNDTYAQFLGLGEFLNGSYYSAAWDAHKLYGCLCDSSWAVGLGAGERQSPEWFGPDCSMRHCPSADDPLTTTVDETDCFNTTTGPTPVNGSVGNLCHVDCANRGVCNYRTGACACFKGHYGHDCTIISALSTGTGNGNQVEIVPQDQYEHYRQRPFRLQGGRDDMGEYFADKVPDN